MSAPISQVLQALKKEYPDAHCALNYQNPFELLIATILSAQCTDERVNQVTAILFKKYPDPFQMAKAKVKDLEKIVHPTGFYHNKAKNIKACSQALVDRHQGAVPQELEHLIELAGVGRKTANVVLGNAFGIPSGVVVDTHVKRLSQRFGWTQSDNAVVIERELSEVVPKKNWIMLPHWLISHGRAVCKARNPQCDSCVIADLCPSRISE